MTRLERVLLRAAADLDQANVDWALVGGLAVSARTEPRFTRDVDLAVAVSGDAEAEALVNAQRANGYVVVASVEHEAAARLATVRLHPPGEQAGGVIVDLLFASSGIEPELVAASERISFTDAIKVPVATVGHLIAAKLLAETTRPARRIASICARSPPSRQTQTSSRHARPSPSSPSGAMIGDAT